MIGERYTLGQLYKAGAQAKVWKASDKITGAQRIIKTGDGMKKEAVLARQLMHPMIGYPYDCGDDPELGEFAVYPEFTGMNSMEWVQNNGKESLRAFTLQATEFLSYLHHRGWLYNDFKPQHFVLCENRLKVLDLGLCSPIKSSGSSTMFSGTFPYISPERLNGRPFDQRSDIFAFGILLLHLLLPEEKFPEQPSIGSLNSLLYKVKSLKEPWKKIISEMTALEPSQRIADANELWKRLAPDKETKIAIHSYGIDFLLPEQVIQEKHLQIHSPSEPLLEEAFNQLLISSWERNNAVFSFDLRVNSPDQCFEWISATLSGGHSGSLYSAIEFLRTQQRSPVRLIFRSVETLNPEQRAILLFGLSCLTEVSWIKAVLLTSISKLSGLGESWTRFDIPVSGNTIHFSVESLNPASKKILNALAVAGGTLPRASLNAWNEDEVLDQLTEQGLLLSRAGFLSLPMPAETLLSRMRPGQKQAVALRLLATEKRPADPSMLFYLASNANRKALAARSALQQANRFSATKDQSSQLQWYWNAFHSGAKLSKSLLFQMTKQNLLHGDLEKSRSLLKQIRARFGPSFLFGDLVLDYFHRKHKLEPAIRVTVRCAREAGRRGKRKLQEYFLARQAGFLILENEFEQAQQILQSLGDIQNPRVRGLAHHFYGMIDFYQGHLNDSFLKFRQACRTPHRFRSSSAMNIGMVLGQMGQFQKAERWLRRSISVFSRTQDQDKLSRAFNNLGMLYLSASEILKARDHFIRALHLGRACKNPHNYLLPLNNLGITYELEGRIDKAIQYRTRVYKLARKFKLTNLQMHALSNAGLHLAYLGRFQRAISTLKEVVHVRSELKLKLPQARAYEYLGITYLLAKRFHSAEKSLLRSKKLFQETGCSIDSARVDCFLTILAIERKNPVDARIFTSMHQFTPDSFEEGIFCYGRAIHALSVRDDKNAIDSLHVAERIFRKIPSLFWLAKVHKMKSEYYRKTENLEKLTLSLQAAYHLFSQLGARKELQNLPKDGLDMQIYEDFLNRLADRLPYRALHLIKEILSLEEVDAMVTKILHTALELTSMDRALLILNEEPPRVFQSAALEESNLQDILEVSRSVLQSATDSNQPVLSFDALSDPRLQYRPSIINNRILSVVCLPLRTGSGRTLGCLYLDSKEGVETLAGTETVTLEIFSSIIGLALNQSLLLEKSVTENRRLRDWLELRKECPEIIGSSKEIADVMRTVHRVLNNNLPVLITGETGTGKELVARVLHYSGGRKKGPFIAVNCAAFTRELLESELFGHEKGAFTGAIQLKKGVFEQAQNGTLFLDEIGDMPLEMQAKLLRVLQGGEYRRLGGTETFSTNARIILATNRNLEEMVAQGNFRVDLFYRVKVVDIHIPPLRDRTEDISLLATSFLKQAAISTGKDLVGFTPAAMDALRHYSWPGNVRELKSEIDRAAALCDEEWIDARNLDQRITHHPVSEKKRQRTDSSGSLSQIEKDIIRKRLQDYNWNVVAAAKSLGITRHGLYSKMKRYGISLTDRT